MAKKLPKRMFKNQEMVSPYQLSQSPIKRMQRISRDHPDVLQNIELALMNWFRQDPQMDDRVADEALAAVQTNQPPDDPLVLGVFEDLVGVREMQAKIPDDLWRDALKVIRDSIRRHSELKPREKSYLVFVSQYVR